MTTFQVAGPYVIPAVRKKGGWVIPPDPELKDFWSNVDCADQTGCYIFCYQHGKCITPIYVGRATERSLREEALAPHKRSAHYLPSMAEHQRGAFSIIFVTAAASRGAPPSAKIKELEMELIEHAYHANRDLSNVKGKPDYGYSIQGVLRSPRGKPSQSALTLRATLRL